MKFDAPPPYGNACDFMVNMTDCQGSGTYLIIYGVGAIIHLLCIFVGVNVIIRFRQKRSVQVQQHRASLFIEAGQRTFSPPQKPSSSATMAKQRPPRSRRVIPRPIRVTTGLAILFIIARLIHTTLCALDAALSLGQRSALLIVSILPGLWTLLIFAAGVVETVELTIDGMPARQAICVNDLRWSLPSRHFIILFLAVLGLGMTVAAPLLAWIAGKHGDQGEWPSYFLFIGLAWSICGSVFIVLGILYSYYAGALTLMIRQLRVVERAEQAQLHARIDERRRQRHLEATKSLDGTPVSTPRLSSATESGTIGAYSSDTAVNSRSPSMQAGGDEDPQAAAKKGAPPRAKFSALYRYAFQEQQPGSAGTLSDADLDDATIPEHEEDDADDIGEETPICALSQQRRTMYYLIGAYFFCAIIALAWGNDARSIIMHRIASKVFAVAFVAALWPLAVGAILWKRWRMERVRERKEALRMQRAHAPRDVTREWYRTLAAITHPWSHRTHADTTVVAPAPR